METATRRSGIRLIPQRESSLAQIEGTHNMLIWRAMGDGLSMSEADTARLPSEIAVDYFQ